MKKKTFSIILAIVLMLTFSVSAMADGAAKITGDCIECSSGDTVKFSVSISNNPGITAYVIGVYSESDWISFAEEAEMGDFTSTGSVETSSDPQLANVAWFNADAVEGDGTLFTIDVNVSVSAPSGDYPIQVLVSQENTIDGDCEEIEYETVDGCITVEHIEVVNTNEDVENTNASTWWVYALIAAAAVIAGGVVLLLKRKN